MCQHMREYICPIDFRFDVDPVCEFVTGDDRIRKALLQFGVQGLFRFLGDMAGRHGKPIQDTGLNGTRNAQLIAQAAFRIARIAKLDEAALVWHFKRENIDLARCCGPACAALLASDATGDDVGDRDPLGVTAAIMSI
ncbi:MAG: hypothetical protein CMH13_03245 [Martelella sp.]|nr:hypothetical protein [Martelella sp.]